MSLFIEEEGNIKLDFDTEEIAALVIDAALELADCPYEAEINLLLTENAQIHEMNLEQRGIDRPTDVLSFPMLEYETPGDFSHFESEEDCFDPETGELLLGDIVISKEKVIITDLFHLFDISDTVYVEMIERKPSLFVYLYDGKCRTADRFCDSKSSGDSLGKHCFSNAKVAVQGIDLSRFCLFAKFLTQCKGFLGTVCFYYHCFSSFFISDGFSASSHPHVSSEVPAVSGNFYRLLPSAIHRHLLC